MDPLSISDDGDVASKIRNTESDLEDDSAEFETDPSHTARSEEIIVVRNFDLLNAN